MPTWNFADRFSFPQPDGISPTVTSTQAELLTEAEIIAASPELDKLAVMVRAHSVLLKRRTTLEIFKIITEQQDPRIALVLAAAKKRTDNSPLFKGLDEVKEVMYATPLPGASETFLNRNLFSDGIRRVSAALTAAFLIGQLAQITEQAEHSKVLERQALEDLDRICLTYELSQNATNDPNAEETEKSGSSFFFLPADVEQTLSQRTVVSWFSVGLTSFWKESGSYTGNFSSWQVVADLAESINTATIISNSTMLVAVPELASIRTDFPEIHSLSFYPRSPLPGVLAHSLSIRIEQIDGDSRTGASPFRWGLHWNSMTTRVLNGAIIVLKNNKHINFVEKERLAEPTVIYFRNKYKYPVYNIQPQEVASIRIRVQFFQADVSAPSPDYLEIEFNRVRSLGSQDATDNLRFSQAAVEVLKAVTINRNESGVSGAIIRNDPVDGASPIAAIELLAWTLSRKNTYVILDIMSIPDDIEIATGGLHFPAVAFSNNPKSVRAACQVIGYGVSSASTDGGQTKVVKRPKKSETWRKIKDEALGAERRWPV